MASQPVVWPSVRAEKGNKPAPSLRGQRRTEKPDVTSLRKIKEVSSTCVHHINGRLARHRNGGAEKTDPPLS